LIWQIDLILLVFVLICGVASIVVKDLLSSAIIFGTYSFFMCVLWTEMGAVDVAFTEASVGAGTSTIFFIDALLQTTHRQKD